MFQVMPQFPRISKKYCLITVIVLINAHDAIGTHLVLSGLAVNKRILRD